MKRLMFVYLSVLLGLTASPALASHQKGASQLNIPQSIVAPTNTGMDIPVNSQVPRNRDSMRNQTYCQYFPPVREGGNHQKPQYNLKGRQRSQEVC